MLFPALTTRIALRVCLALGSFLLQGRCPLAAQVPFERTYGGDDGEFGYGVLQTPDGGYVMAGTTFSLGVANGDMLLMRVGPDGGLQWTRSFGTADLDVGYALVQTGDGGFALCGMFNGPVGDTLTIVRTDAAGNLLWERQYPGTLGRDLGYALQQTSDGGFMVAGSSGATLDDAYIVRTDASGDLIWTRTIDLGGQEMASALQLTPDDGAYVLVRNSGFADPNGELYLMRMAATGDTLWTRTYVTPGVDEARGLALTDDGGCIIAGSNGYPTRAIQIIRTDAQGQELWRQVFDNAHDELLMDVRPMEDGGFAFVGSRQQDAGSPMAMLLLRTDAAGEPLWERTYPRGPFSEGVAMDRTGDGGFVLVGSTFVQVADGGHSDLFLVRTDGAGYTAVPEPAQDLNAVVYPNPTADAVTIALGEGRMKQIGILDAAGRTVWSAQGLEASMMAIDLMQLPSGTYMVVVLGHDQGRSQQRLIIAR